MNFDEIKKSPMNEEFAKQITEWIYEGDYSDYNLPSYEQCKNEKYGMTREDRWNNYIVYTINNEVVFYSNMKEMDNNKLYIGVGLKPEYCGKGLGNFFLNDSINEMKKIYPERTFS